MKLKICIIDDNLDDINKIKKELTTYINENDIECFNDLNTFNIKIRYDLYFIDIDMPIMNGFELSEKISKYNENAIFIFVTSHSELVNESFKYNTFYFVRKNELEKDLKYTFIKLNNNFKNKYYILKQGNKYLRILINEIEYIEKENKDVVIHIQDKEYHTKDSLKDSVTNLNSNFIYIDTGIVVNIKKIKNIQNKKIELESNKILYCSRRKYKELLHAYTNLRG